MWAVRDNANIEKLSPDIAKLVRNQCFICGRKKQYMAKERDKNAFKLTYENEFLELSEMFTRNR